MIQLVSLVCVNKKRLFWKNSMLHCKKHFPSNETFKFSFKIIWPPKQTIREVNLYCRKKLLTSVYHTALSVRQYYTKINELQYSGVKQLRFLMYSLWLSYVTIIPIRRLLLIIQTPSDRSKPSMNEWMNEVRRQVSKHQLADQPTLLDKASGYLIGQRGLIFRLRHTTAIERYALGRYQTPNCNVQCQREFIPMFNWTMLQGRANTIVHWLIMFKSSF